MVGRWLGPGLAVVLAVAGCSPATKDRSAPAGGTLPLPAPRGFRVDLDHEQRSRAGQVRWRTEWVLTWARVAGAAGYRVQTGTSEGVGRTSVRHEIEDPRFTIEVAAGTSRARNLERDRGTQLVLTASQLLVRVVAVDAGGQPGRPSPWFPVGELSPDRRPVPRLVGDSSRRDPRLMPGR